LPKGKKARPSKKGQRRISAFPRKRKKSREMMGRKTTIETMGREKSQASRLLDGGKSGCNGCANQTKGIGDSIVS
jgi:hypothetical protein